MKLFAPLINAIRDADLDPTSHNHALAMVREAKAKGHGLIFVGNGGSAAIASHMAADYLKTFKISAQCFNDGALTTCMANDYGYDHVFEYPISMNAKPGDVLFAVSSSGRSPNILNAVKAARKMGVQSITLSGFDKANPLRSLGDVNFYVPSDRYGIVEVCHLAICHAILDAVCDAK